MLAKYRYQMVAQPRGWDQPPRGPTRWTRRRALLPAAAVAAFGASCSPLASGDAAVSGSSPLERPVRLAVSGGQVEYLPDERAWLIRAAALEERLELRPYDTRSDQRTGPFRLVRAYLRTRAIDVQKMDWKGD